MATADASPTPQKSPWEIALDSHLSSLKPSERYILVESTSAKDLVALVESSLNVAKRKRADRFLRTVHRCAQPLQEFQSVFDVLAQVSSAIGCTVWAPLKLILIALQKYSTAFDTVADTVQVLVDALPRYKVYCDQFRQSEMLQESLGMVFATYVQFCLAIIRFLDGNSVFGSFLRIQAGVFDKRLEPILKELKRHAKRVEQTAAALSLVYIQHVKEATEELKATSLSQQEKLERERTLTWLAPEKFAEDRRIFSREWVNGTCQWAFDSKETIDWMGEEALEGRRRVLWINGIVGSGKTFVAHFMSQTLVKDGAVVAEYFFDSKTPHSSRRLEISFIRSVLYQLLVHPRIEAAEAFKSLHEYRSLSGTSTASSSSQLYSAVTSLFKSLETPYLLVDALDECNPPEIEDVLDHVRDLCEQCPSLRVLLTSRPDPEITEWFHKRFSTLGQSLIVSKEMVEKDIYKFLDMRIQKSRKLKHPQIEDKVRSKITERSEGMFLFARLILDELEQEETVESVRRKLEVLPNSLSSYYSEYFFRLKAAPASRQRLALQVIFWTIAMRTTVDVHTLVTGIRSHMCMLNNDNINDGVSLEDDLLDPVKQVQSAAYPLIVVREDDVVQVVHCSLTQYILAEGIGSLIGSTQVELCLNLPQAHSEIVLSCLHFLTQNLSQNGLPINPRCLCVPNNGSPGASEDGNAAFLAYAVLFWNENLVASQPFYQLQLKALHQFSNPAGNAFNEWAKLRASMDFAFKICFGISEGNAHINPLEIAVYSGTESWTNTILEEDQPSHILQRAVHLTAERGFVSILKRLFETGNWVECKDSNGRTPLHLAARHGHAEVVKFLLGCKANVHALDNRGHSILMHASSCGHLQVVKDLLLAGADISVKTSSGFCALSGAAANGYFQVVKCLVECSSLTVETSQSLLLASANGYENIVEYLLTKGGNAASWDQNQWTPLHWATRNGHYSIAKALLKSGADSNAVDRLSRTPLSRSARNGHLECVNILLEAQADANVADIYGVAPVHYASINGHDKVIRALAAAGASLNLKDAKGRQPLHHAAFKGYESIIRQLIGAGINLDAQENEDSDSALHIAAAGGFANIVNLLLQAGANCSVCKVKSLSMEDKTYISHRTAKFWYYSSLCSALEQGQNSIAWSLLWHMESLVKARNCNLQVRVKLFKDALSVAILKDCPTELIAGILEAQGGSAVDSQSRFDAAELAAAYGRIDALSLLFKFGFEPDYGFDKSILSIAVENGQVGTVNFLLGQEKINKRDLDPALSGSAIHLVIQQKSSEMFELFRNRFSLPPSTALIYAVQNDDNRQVNDLIEQIEPGMPLEGCFHAAVGRHSADAVKKLLELSGNLLPQYRKDSLLARSCLTGDLATAKALLDAGADVNGTELSSTDGQPALIIAAVHGHRDVLELLLQHKANPSIANRSGRSGVHELSHPNDPNLNLGDYEYCPCSLPHSAEGFRVHTIRRLIDAGAGCDDIDISGYTPLHLSILSGFRDVFEELVGVKSSLGPVGSLQITAMHVAARSGNTTFIQRLLDLHVDINSVDARGMTPLCWAAIKNVDVYYWGLPVGSNKKDLEDMPGSFWGSGEEDFAQYLDHLDQPAHAEAVRTLLEAGASLEFTDPYGRTPLHLACRCSRVDVTRTLLLRGANVDAVDHDQRTPLHLAVIAGSLPCVRLLLSYGANSNLADSSSFSSPPEPDNYNPILSTISSFERQSRQSYMSNYGLYNTRPIFYAISGSREFYGGVVSEVAAEITRLLLMAGADIRAVNNNGETILHVAVRSKMYRIVEEILAFDGVRGELKNMKDKWGKTAADHATESGDDPMKKIFGTTGRGLEGKVGTKVTS